jgi:hypothetical protein
MESANARAMNNIADKFEDMKALLEGFINGLKGSCGQVLEKPGGTAALEVAGDALQPETHPEAEGLSEETHSQKGNLKFHLTKHKTYAKLLGTWPELPILVQKCEIVYKLQSSLFLCIVLSK